MYYDKLRKNTLKEKRKNSVLNPEKKALKVGSLIKKEAELETIKLQLVQVGRSIGQIFTFRDFPTTCPLCGKLLAKKDVGGCHIEIYHQKP